VSYNPKIIKDIINAMNNIPVEANSEIEVKRCFYEGILRQFGELLRLFDAFMRRK
jgi:hypothetical protein